MRDTSDTIVQFEFGEDGTSPVKVSSNEEHDIDVDQIADRIMDEEFDTDKRKDEFLGDKRPPTNLSEYADARGVEGDD